MPIPAECYLSVNIVPCLDGKKSTETFLYIKMLMKKNEKNCQNVKCFSGNKEDSP